MYFLLKMVIFSRIFHCYVSLPEGRFINPTYFLYLQRNLDSGACILLSRLAADGDAAVASLLVQKPADAENEAAETEVDMLELVIVQLEAVCFFWATLVILGKRFGARDDVFFRS